MKHAMFGVVAIVFGIVGLIYWWATFAIVMRGLLPFGLLIVGMIALLSGYQRIIAETNDDEDDADSIDDDDQVEGPIAHPKAVADN